ncbi:MAG TPA: endonuclease/exonuclease/phosphatase family protein [Gemmataceae bacterium]|nr:endonuclease/exonuclease/phosphatase family protein [Gemmataceae bacterium]
MAKNRADSGQVIASAIKLFMQLSRPAKIAVVALIVVGLIVYVVVSGRMHPTEEELPPGQTPPSGQAPTTGTRSSIAWSLPPSGTVVFMLWNVENLFDDIDDKRNSIDEPYDNWFATDAEARRLKYDHLAEIIVKQNGGKGPDVLVCVEVESVRAATLLKDTLNAKLPEGTPTYEYIGMRDLDAGRHIAPAMISRVPLDDARTALHGRDLRILEVHVVIDKRDLCVIASHWTSQLQQRDGSHGEKGRMKYATTVYELFEKAARENPEVDLLVCGDFNDTPDSDAVVNGLHMTADRSAVIPTGTHPQLLGLLSGKPPEQFGTHYYNQPLIYDQIGVSAGMLDRVGWGCEPDSVRVFTDGLIRDRARTRRPWRFGNKNDDALGRGYADHFPVVVNLRVVP